MATGGRERGKKGVRGVKGNEWEINRDWRLWLVLGEGEGGIIDRVLKKRTKG